jgi:hypothetical protein
MSRRALHSAVAAPLLLLAAVLAACDSPTVPAPVAGYDFSLAAPGGPIVYRWPLGATVRVFPVAGDAARAGVLDAALDHAIAAWNDAVLFGEYRLARAARPDEAHAILAWSDVALPIVTGGCPPSLTGRAVTTFCADPVDTGRIAAFPLLDDEVPSPVRMVVLIRASEASDAERVRRLVAHELGHVIGIGAHSVEPLDLMFGGTLETALPSVADRATVRRLYRTDPGLRP